MRWWRRLRSWLGSFRCRGRRCGNQPYDLGLSHSRPRRSAGPDKSIRRGFRQPRQLNTLVSGPCGAGAERDQCVLRQPGGGARVGELLRRPLLPSDAGDNEESDQPEQAEPEHDVKKDEAIVAGVSRDGSEASHLKLLRDDASTSPSSGRKTDSASAPTATPNIRVSAGTAAPSRMAAMRLARAS